ncbi:MAG: DUF2062 domain-containing protein [Oceanicoccus sp.]
MARKIIKRFVPGPDWVKKQRSLRFLDRWLHEPNIWHLTRQSVANAVFIGVFVAFIPIPLQMIIAAMLAIALNANMPISVVLVWISNPLTVAPIFYLAFKVGAAVIEVPADSFDFELSWQWIEHELGSIWQPFLLGCVLCGTFFGLLGSTMVRWLWRRHTIKRWHQRRLRREARK